MSASLSNPPEDQIPASSTPPANAADGKRPLAICLASPDFIGPSPHGPAASSCTAMAQALATAGHQVTCLLLGARLPSSNEWQRWVEKYRGDGLTLVALPSINASELVAPPNLIKSYEVYQWLKKNDRFDIIHFPERQGPGYHTLTAKHHGLAFSRATICVGLHTMTAWLQAADPKPVNTLAEVDTEFMERRAVALADAVVGPGQNIVEAISAPRRVKPGGVRPAAFRLREINELVYYGTLEPSKGAVLFCDALDSIPADIAKKIKTVTFLGRESLIDGVPALNYVRQRAQLWPFPFQFMADLTEAGTTDYLRQENRLAVIPTLRESSLYRVLECLVARIAFVASRVGGVTELIAPADVDKICFEPNAAALRSILCAVLTEGIHPARANEHPPMNGSGNPPVRLDPAPPAHAPALSLEAAQSAIQALSIDPTDAVALKVLARIHLNAGLNEAAQEACQLILKGHAEDAEALQMLEEAKRGEKIIDSNGSVRPREEAGCQEALRAIAAGFTAPFACA